MSDMTRLVILIFFLLLTFPLTHIATTGVKASTGQSRTPETTPAFSEKQDIFGTSTIFSEDFEGPFPASDWNVYDLLSDNGDDYWDDTSTKSHGGSWSGWCADEGNQFVNYTIWTETFEGEFPASNWNVVDREPLSGNDTWDDTNYRSYAGSWSGWCAQIGEQLVGGDTVPNSAVHNYDDYMWTTMLRWVNVSGYDYVFFSYWYWTDTENADKLWVAYHTWDQPGGENTYLNPLFGNSGGWQHTEVSIPTNAMWVALGFWSDSANHEFEGAYVDDVELVGAFEIPNRSLVQYDDNMQAYMYRSVNLTAYASATLSYWYWTDTEFGYDYLQVLYFNSTNSYYIDIHQGNSSGWQYSAVDIPVSAYYVGFYFRSDNSLHGYEGAYIDDVLLVGTEKPGILEGTVFDVMTSVPIADAYLWTGGPGVFTNSSGQYRFELEAGVYDVFAYRDYYYHLVAEGIAVVSGLTSTVDFYLTPGYSNLTNGGFETGDLTAWALYDTHGYPVGSSTNVTVTNTQARSGAFSLQLQGQSQVMQVFNKPAMLKGNLIFWAKCRDPGVTSGISFATITDPGTSPTTYTMPLGDTWTKFVISIPEGSQWIQVIFATYLPDYPEGGTNPEVKLIDDIWIGYEPLIESCDQTGTPKNVFEDTETVYVFGNGYPQSFLCNVYLVEDTLWTDGMQIPLGSGTLTTTWSNSSGGINAAPIYYPPLTPGKYDIIVDVNDNGKYDAGIDALDDNDVELTAGIFVPELSLLFMIFALAMVSSVLFVSRGLRRKT